MTTIGMGGLRFALHGERFAQFEIDSELPRFTVPDPEGAVTVAFTTGERSGATWTRSVLETCELAPGGELFMERTEWRATFDLAARRVDAHLTGPWARGLESLLATATQLFSLELGRGAVYHASCVVSERGAVLYTGRSGAGKTTAATLSREAGGVRLIAEDMTLVEVDDAGAGWVHTLPFWQRGGTLVGPERHRLLGLCDLKQAPSDDLRVMTQGEALGRLLGAVSIGARVPSMMSAAWRHCDRLSRLVPVAELRFRKAPDFWALVRERFEV